MVAKLHRELSLKYLGDGADAIQWALYRSLRLSRSLTDSQEIEAFRRSNLIKPGCNYLQI